MNCNKVKKNSEMSKRRQSLYSTKKEATAPKKHIGWVYVDEVPPRSLEIKDKILDLNSNMRTRRSTLGRERAISESSIKVDCNNESDLKCDGIQSVEKWKKAKGGLVKTDRNQPFELFELSEAKQELVAKSIGVYTENNWYYSNATTKIETILVPDVDGFNGKLTRRKVKELLPDFSMETKIVHPPLKKKQRPPPNTIFKNEIDYHDFANGEKCAAFSIIAEYDDILTNLLLDSFYLGFTTHKMSPDFETKCIFFALRRSTFRKTRIR
jgi:hypothetical protein